MTKIYKHVYTYVHAYLHTYKVFGLGLGVISFPIGLPGSSNDFEKKERDVCFIPVGFFSDRRVFRILFYWDPRLFRMVFRKGLEDHLEPILSIDRIVIHIIFESIGGVVIFSGLV